MSTHGIPELNLIGWPAPEQAPPGRLQPLPALSRTAAYRRLAVATLRLDVASLAADLRAERLGQKLPHAA